MSALDVISKKDNPQPRAATVTMNFATLQAVVNDIAQEVGAEPVNPNGDTPEWLARRIWDRLGGRAGG